MKRIRLEVVGGDAGSAEIPLTLPATIGRGREASVSLSHPLVSRAHCEIVESQGRVMVRDLQSLNGTFVGSDRIEEACLKPGDLLTVGTVTFRAFYEDAAQQQLPSPHICTSPIDELSKDQPDDPMSRTSGMAKPSGRDTFRVKPPRPEEPIAPDTDDAQFTAESDV